MHVSCAEFPAGKVITLSDETRLEEMGGFALTGVKRA